MQQVSNFQYASHTTITGGRRYGARLTPQEEEIIKVSFESFSAEEHRPGDPPGKRYINAEKLTEAFISINAKGDMQDIQLLLDDIDENGEGIDEEMWRHIMSRKFLGEEDDSSFGHVFAMLDDNKDGFIPLVELRKMLMQEGQAPLSEQEVDELLMFADADSDGLIDYRRFLLWLSHPEAYHKDQADSKTAVATNAAQAKAGAKAPPGAKPQGIAGIPGGGPTGPKAAPGSSSPKAAGPGLGAASPKGPGPAASPKGPGPAASPKGPGPAASPKGPGPAASPKGPGPAASPKGPGPAASPKGPGPPAPPKAKAPPGAGPGGPRPDTGGGVGDLSGAGGAALSAEQQKKVDEMEQYLVLNGVNPVDTGKVRRVLASNGWKVDDNALAKYMSS